MNLRPIDRYAALRPKSGGGDNPDPGENHGPGTIPTQPTSEPG